MKKLKISVSVLAFVGLAVLNFTQSESCFVKKSLASSSSGSSISSSTGVIDHGDDPSLECPVWRKTYHFGTGSTGLDCESEGKIKCRSGKCPHEV